MKQTEQRICNNCFTPLAPGARFCPECGTPAPQRVVGTCPNCGQTIMEGQAACFRCGTLVGAMAQPAAPKKKPVSTGLWMGLLVGLLVAIIAVAVVLLFQPRNAESVELGRSQVSMLPGQRLQLKYEVLPENTPDKSVTWRSSDDSVATVKNGEVVAQDPGRCTVTVTTANGLEDSCVITVSDYEAQALVLSETALTLHVGQEVALSVQVLPADAETEIIWSTSNENVAAVASGQITALSLGSCTVSVTAENGVTAQCAVTVALREEELLPVGSWQLTGIEDRFEGTARPASGGELTLTESLSGALVRDGEKLEFTWQFANTDSEGDTWYDVLGTEESIQFVCSADGDTLTVYLPDENWVFAPAQ